MLKTVVEVEVVVLIILYSLMTAGLSWFIWKCMEPKMIFRRYYLWLTYLWIISWRRKDRWVRRLLKPAGLCIWCFSTWIGIFLYLYKFGFNIEILLFIGMQFIWLQILKEFVKVEL